MDNNKAGRFDRFMPRSFYGRFAFAIFLKIIAASYFIGLFWLIFAAMRFLGVPWYFCIIICGVTLICEFDWDNNLLCGILRMPLPKRLK
jgi:hypothetical protein